MSGILSKDIPNFIMARSPRGLRLLMFKINARAAASHRFYDISSYPDETGKIKWIAWYLSDGLEADSLTEVSDDDAG